MKESYILLVYASALMVFMTNVYEPGHSPIYITSVGIKCSTVKVPALADTVNVEMLSIIYPEES